MGGFGYLLLPAEKFVYDNFFYDAEIVFEFTPGRPIFTKSITWSIKPDFIS